MRVCAVRHSGGSQGLHFDEDWSGGGGGLATSAWRMLKKYLKQYDPVHVNGYRKAVAHKILSLDNRIKLPKWLVESFKVCLRFHACVVLCRVSCRATALTRACAVSTET